MGKASHSCGHAYHSKRTPSAMRPILEARWVGAVRAVVAGATITRIGGIEIRCIDRYRLQHQNSYRRQAIRRSGDHLTQRRANGARQRRARRGIGSLCSLVFERLLRIGVEQTR